MSKKLLVEENGVCYMATIPEPQVIWENYFYRLVHRYGVDDEMDEWRVGAHIYELEEFDGEDALGHRRWRRANQLPVTTLVELVRTIGQVPEVSPLVLEPVSGDDMTADRRKEAIRLCRNETIIQTLTLSNER